VSYLTPRAYAQDAYPIGHIRYSFSYQYFDADTALSRHNLTRLALHEAGRNPTLLLLGCRVAINGMGAGVISAENEVEFRDLGHSRNR
jgi:hypothetical protein